MFIAGIVVSLMVLPIIAVGHPRGVLPDAAGREGGGPGPRRHPVGHDPHRRAAVRPGRHHRRLDARARAGRSARRSRCRCCCPRSPMLTARILQDGGATISGFIALRAGGDEFTASGLMAAGLVLFVLTLVDEHDRLDRDRPEPLGRRGGGVMTAPTAPTAGRSAAPPSPPRRPVAPAPTGPAAGADRPSSTASTTACWPARPSSALAFTWLVFTRLTEGVGWFGFVLVTYVVFLGLFAVVTADRVGRLTAGDRVATVVDHDRGGRPARAARLAGRLHRRQGPAGAAAALLPPRPAGRDRHRPGHRRRRLHAIVGSLDAGRAGADHDRAPGARRAVFLNETAAGCGGRCGSWSTR